MFERGLKRGLNRGRNKGDTMCLSGRKGKFNVCLSQRVREMDFGSLRRVIFAGEKGLGMVVLLEERLCLGAKACYLLL